MKTAILVLVGAMFVTVIIAFLIFNFNISLTGLATYDLNDTNDNSVNLNVNEQMVLDSIIKAEEIMGKMQASNLSIDLVNDTILQAKIVFQQVKYAEVLRNSSSDAKAILEANAALRLINWKGINYSSVLYYTNRVDGMQEQAFLILDKIASLEGDNSGLSLETRALLEDAKLAFKDERYNEAEMLILQFRDAKERELTQNSSLSGISEGAKNFFQRYWLPLIIFIVGLFLLGRIFAQVYSKKRLAKKIRRMKFEQSALLELMKKTQTERFKENTISGLVYNIKMKNYKERTNEIKEQLPVLEERLKKM